MGETMPRNKAELIERIESARAELERLIAPLSEEQLTRPGPEGWSIKDHLAHLALWRKSLIALLAGRNRVEAIGLDPAGEGRQDIDAINARLYERERDRPLAEVL